MANLQGIARQLPAYVTYGVSIKLKQAPSAKA